MVSCTLSSKYKQLLFSLSILIFAWGCDGFGTFGFDIHHRFSDPVKGILAVDDLPEKGSLEYYRVMTHRDRVIHGRRLAATVNQSLLTFFYGNETFRISSLGYLHYANVSVGTPSVSFLVALDTGSDLFWLPCNCTSCVQSLVTSSGARIDLNIYSPNASSTSTAVPCNSSICNRRSRCSATPSSCPYQVVYLSNNTSSNGFLVEDLLHLTTDDNQSKAVNAQIPFGCGQVQTGSFLEGAAPNGLLGLGIDNVSVPSVLATQGLASNSFSMCFGADGIGRITFGDKGSSDQGETPFNIGQQHPTYNISITQIIVGEKIANLSFTAIFDSGTSFTYLNDPAYTLISENFNSQVQETRHQSDPSIPFEYCYDLRSNQVNITVPDVNLTMGGGNSFSVNQPLVFFSFQGGVYGYCLGVVKSGDVNIIGQNFMTGYRVVFDREKMVLGWKTSNCYDVEESSTLPINPGKNSTIPPTVSVTPQATAGPRSSTEYAGSPPNPSSNSPKLSHFKFAFLIVFPILAIL